MSDIQLFNAADIPDVAVRQPADARSARATQTIVAEVVDAARLSGLRAHWPDLLTRADVSNALMDPVMVRAAADAFPEAHIRAVIAWTSADKRQLAGIWAFSVERPHQSALPVRMLAMPPGPHRYLATPVIDRDNLDGTLNAMLDALAADPALPKIAALDAMSADSATNAALMCVLAARGSAPCVLEEFRRPKLVAGLDGKTYLEKAVSGSSRKKLRQHRRRLGEKGALTTVVAADRAAVSRALEDFMQMEAAGWKGRQGTALLCEPASAEFMRKAIIELADLGSASIHALYLDGKPVSMQVIVRAGSTAYTWKTAYDEQHQDFSPGMLLLEDYTAAFLADSSIVCVDSCAHDERSYMSVWMDRQTVADMWIDVRRGGSLSFRMLGLLQRRYRDARAILKDGYLALQSRFKQQAAKG